MITLQKMVRYYKWSWIGYPNPEVSSVLSEADCWYKSLNCCIADAAVQTVDIIDCWGGPVLVVSEKGPHGVKTYEVEYKWIDYIRNGGSIACSTLLRA